MGVVREGGRGVGGGQNAEMFRSGPVRSGSKKIRGAKSSELGPGTPLDGFSVKNYGGYANFQLQRSSERQLAFSGPVRSGSATMGFSLMGLITRLMGTYNPTYKPISHL